MTIFATAPFNLGQRVVRNSDGQTGVVTGLTPFSPELWDVSVRFDSTGKVWSGTAESWQPIPATPARPATFESYAEFLLALKLTRTLYADAAKSREADVAADAADGYRPHYCIHGTNQWTDYDNICGGCEDGITLLNMAVRDAVRRTVLFRERLAFITESHRVNAPIDHVTLLAWASEPLGVLAPTTV